MLEMETKAQQPRNGMGPAAVAPWTARRRLRRMALPVFLVAAALRVGLLDHQGMWPDEVFSLALATGHSLEHPAEAADPAQGDYVEAKDPLAAPEYARYLEHETPPAGLSRVVRATLLSDTSPPLYYMLLYGWTRLFGADETTLRAFSVLSSLVALGVLWLVAQRLDGAAASAAATVLFAVSPICLYYSTEGRMYSLLWVCASATLWATLQLRRQGVWSVAAVGWVAASACGLLVHYFFGLAWGAALMWLLLYPDRARRWQVLTAAAAVLILVSPCYVHLPEALRGWRVSQGWLNHPQSDYNALEAHLLIPWRLFSIRGVWGVRAALDVLNAVIFGLLAWAIWRRGQRRAALWSHEAKLLWLTLAFVCAGPLVLGHMQGTYVIAVERYFLAGLPAALLLFGIALARLSHTWRVTFLALVVTACLVGVRRIYVNPSRQQLPLREIGRLIIQRSAPDDVVIVHSIPSGVAGIAWYVDRYDRNRILPDGPRGGAPAIASWVGQLHLRQVPEDVRSLIAGHRRVLFVRAHEVGEAAPEERWLRDHADVKFKLLTGKATVLEFGPRQGQIFPPADYPMDAMRDSVHRSPQAASVPPIGSARRRSGPRCRSR